MLANLADRIEYWIIEQKVDEIVHSRTQWGNESALSTIEWKVAKTRPRVELEKKYGRGGGWGNQFGAYLEQKFAINNIVNNNNATTVYTKRCETQGET